MTETELVQRCLADRREKQIQALVDTLQDIADSGPDKEPHPHKGSDHDVLLAYEDGHADAAHELAKKARAALSDWGEA